MTNTMNQVKAVALNTAIVDELKAILGIMTRYNETEDKTEAILAGYNVFDIGVCALVTCSLNSTARIYGIFVCTDHTMDKFIAFWLDNFATEAEKQHNSKYVVSVGEEDARSIYTNTKDMWLGEYGKRRLVFLRTLIMFLSESVHKWHIETTEDIDGTFVEFIPFYTAEELANL